jgi:hypothetical protein
VADVVVAVAGADVAAAVSSPARGEVVPAATFFDFLGFFPFFYVTKNRVSYPNRFSRCISSYLLPTPDRFEAVEEANVLEQIREEPETRRYNEDSHTK